LAASVWVGQGLWWQATSDADRKVRVGGERSDAVANDRDRWMRHGRLGEMGLARADRRDTETQARQARSV
tara:strand:+ start:354 stop:563 length:210 start_codon:yes stop_codon:yes gene_type:complete